MSKLDEKPKQSMESGLRAEVERAHDEFVNADDEHRQAARARYAKALHLFSDFLLKTNLTARSKSANGC